MGRRRGGCFSCFWLPCRRQDEQTLPGFIGKTISPRTGSGYSTSDSEICSRGSCEDPKPKRHFFVDITALVVFGVVRDEENNRRIHFRLNESVLEKIRDIDRSDREHEIVVVILLPQDSSYMEMDERQFNRLHVLNHFPLSNGHISLFSFAFRLPCLTDANQEPVINSDRLRECGFGPTGQGVLISAYPSLRASARNLGLDTYAAAKDGELSSDDMKVWWAAANELRAQGITPTILVDMDGTAISRKKTIRDSKTRANPDVLDFCNEIKEFFCEAEYRVVTARKDPMEDFEAIKRGIIWMVCMLNRLKEVIPHVESLSNKLGSHSSHIRIDSELVGGNVSLGKLEGCVDKRLFELQMIRECLQIKESELLDVSMEDDYFDTREQDSQEASNFQLRHNICHITEACGNISDKLLITRKFVAGLHGLLSVNALRRKYEQNGIRLDETPESFLHTAVTKMGKIDAIRRFLGKETPAHPSSPPRAVMLINNNHEENEETRKAIPELAEGNVRLFVVSVFNAGKIIPNSFREGESAVCEKVEIEASGLLST